MGSCVLKIQIQGAYARTREVGPQWDWDPLTRQFIQQSAMDAPYKPEEEDMTRKHIRFDGQHSGYDHFSITG